MRPSGPPHEHGCRVTLESKRVGEAPDAIAPDGSEVRLLCGTSRGGLAVFSLPPGGVSKAIFHRTVEEVWYCLAGNGRIWRQRGQEEEVLEMSVGLSLTIPVGTRFQFRCDGLDPLEILGVTMPPWPGNDEAVAVEGIWEPTI